MNSLGGMYQGPFREINSPSTAEVKKILDEFQASKAFQKKAPMVFVDEIHRFSKSQQDILLAPVERGDMILVCYFRKKHSINIAKDRSDDREPILQTQCCSFITVSGPCV